MWRYASYCLSESIEEEKNKGIDDEGKTCTGMFSPYLSVVLPEGMVSAVWIKQEPGRRLYSAYEKDKMTEKYPSFFDQLQ